jgi:hypothetical protein
MKNMFKKGEMSWWMAMLVYSLIGLVMVIAAIVSFNPELRNIVFAFGGFT